MNTDEEMLGKLRANEPFGKNQDRSTFDIQALQSCWTISGRAANALENIGLQNWKAEEKRDSLKAEVESLGRELENRRRENQELEQENLSLNGELSEKTITLNRLQERIAEFEAQGFTPEIMDKLEPMVERGGEKLLMQIQNVQKQRTRSVLTDT